MHRFDLHRRLGVLLCAVVLFALAGQSDAANRADAKLKELEKVDVVEKLGAQIPLELAFTDESGKKVRLADLIQNKPVILTFNYSNCPLLCSTQLGGLVDTMVRMDWKLGSSYDVITIGLDPKEKAATTRTTKAEYLRRLKDVPTAGSGWHFLRGDQASIDTLAASVGFGYHYLKAKDEYLHPAVNIVLSPTGKVSGYQYGTAFDPAETRDKLITAGYGEISETLARFIHACYYYEAPPSKTVFVKKIMAYGGVIFLAGFAVALVIMGRKRPHSRVKATK